MLTTNGQIAGIGYRAYAKSLLLVTVVGGAVILAIEPDHTSNLPLFAAYGLWATKIFAAGFLYLAMAGLIVSAGVSRHLSLVSAAVLLPLVFPAVSLVLDYGFGIPDEELTDGSSPVSIYGAEILAVAPFSFAVAVVLALLLQRLTPPKVQEVSANPVSGERPPISDLITAVPSTLGNDIICMHANDHYVEVVTAQGSALVSEKFGDCVSRLSGLDGIQCHRSHWVSLDHVQTLQRTGSAYQCTLSNGMKVPVSRRRYTTIKRRIDASSDR